MEVTEKSYPPTGGRRGRSNYEAAVMKTWPSNQRLALVGSRSRESPFLPGTRSDKILIISYLSSAIRPKHGQTYVRYGR